MHGHRQRRRRDLVQHQHADGRIQTASLDALTDLAAAAHGGLHALVVGYRTAGDLFVARAHACTAAPAQHATLEQSGPFSGLAATSGDAERETVLPQSVLIALELIPGDVARVRVADQRVPLRARNLQQMRAKLGVVRRSVAPVDEGAGIARVVQHLDDA